MWMFLESIKILDLYSESTTCALTMSTSRCVQSLLELYHEIPMILYNATLAPSLIVGRKKHLGIQICSSFPEASKRRFQVLY
jgi:hypothetical protein